MNTEPTQGGSLSVLAILGLVLIWLGAKKGKSGE